MIEEEMLQEFGELGVIREPVFIDEDRLRHLLFTGGFTARYSQSEAPTGTVRAETLEANEDSEDTYSYEQLSELAK